MLLSLCLALLFLRASYANGKLIIFGDSLSDQGNLFAFTGGYPPEPYGDTYGKSGKEGYDFPGRFTDGGNWVDYISSVTNYFRSVTAYLKDGGTNFAVGGSTSGDVNVLQKLFPHLPLPSFPDQILTYLSTVGGHASADDLYVIWIGANDFGAGTNPKSTVDNILARIAQLSNAGAKNIVVIDIPDLSLTPLVRGLGPATIQAAKQFVYSTNVLLEVELLRFAFLHRISIDIVHINAIFIPLVYNPVRFGFTNSMDAAFNPVTNLVLVSDPNDYVFWDGFHPTTNAHYFAAEFIFKAILSRRHFHEFLSLR
jgi:phospholipase/lecithinase/hemolysin